MNRAISARAAKAACSHEHGRILTSSKGQQVQMASLLERYLAGDCLTVWAELTAIGAGVWEEPIYSDALAVARETMRRARYNIELLIERLGSLGYRFGYDWWDADSLFMLEYDPPPPIFAPPSADVQRQLTELETRFGFLPLSLRAWYEEVGGVNFVGMYPVQDPTDPDGFTCYVQFVESGGREKGRQFTKASCAHDLDPLLIYQLERVLQRSGPPMSTNNSFELELAPDEWFKYGVSGSGPYVIRIPNQTADAIVEYEWHDTTFVNYLRTCFRWAGFPGLECKSRRPESELAFLTRDLLPI